MISLKYCFAFWSSISVRSVRGLLSAQKVYILCYQFNFNINIVERWSSGNILQLENVQHKLSRSLELDSTKPIVDARGRVRIMAICFEKPGATSWRVILLMCKTLLQFHRSDTFQLSTIVDSIESPSIERADSIDRQFAAVDFWCQSCGHEVCHG
jgi:hypothetical protein